ncbi:hypothetical protein GMOD_00008351 [Pyrenophora seminiperda CCB06]|uniref:Uncharacterized protein n=1 Tax=Pyrenophora seminiperda CCB06 TaxID=1302712 RepID=A0A3M7M293_9PLEO|nr:hypothetical protein GMOD_00008351 [Pyrenophora seminiperda CCB06]
MASNVPKFTSFRPKPKAAAEPPKDPQHKKVEQPLNDKSTRPHSPSRKSRERDAAASKDYFRDRRGDLDIVRYGTLNRYDIPSYRRFGHGCVLGISTDRKIDREYTTEKAIYITPARGKRQKRLLIDKHAKHSSGRALKVVKLNAGDNELHQDFILLSANGKRIHSDSDDQDEAIQETDYRRIEGANSAELVDTDMQYESDVDVAIDVEVTRKNASLVRQTREHPEDVTGWLALIAHQEAMLKFERPSVELTPSDTAHLADIRISTYKEALKKTGKDHDAQLKLYTGLLKEAERAWDGAKLASEWKEVLERYPENMELWMMHLDFVQSTFTRYKYEDCRSLFLKCMKALGTSASDISPSATLHVLLRLTSMTHSAGYQELALAIWQALLEFHLMRPEGDASMEAFESFWDSEVPRIGEPGAKGWNHYSPSDDATPADFPPLQEKHLSISFFEDFQEREMDATTKLRFPGRAADNLAEDDAFHTIFFDDLKPCLEVVPHNPSVVLLVDAFLCFCGLPPLAIPNIQRGWWSDPFVQHHWQSISSVDVSTHFTQTLKRFSECPARSFQMTTEILFQQNFSLGGINLSANFVRRLLKLLVSEPMRDTEVFGEYLLAFECQNFPKEAFKTAKRLLKGQPMHSRVYNAYGLVEASLGNSAKADQVFHAVLFMGHGDTASLTPETLQVFSNWVWEALQRGEQTEALWRLVSPRTSLPPQHSARNAHPDNTFIHIARITLMEMSERALLDQDYVTAIRSNALLALIAYLSNDCNAEQALEIHRGLSAWFVSHKLSKSPSAEIHAQELARFLTYHVTHAPIVKPSLIRNTVEPLISHFPNNTILLSLYAANEARFSIDDRVRGIMNQNALLSSKERSIAGWAFAIHYEMLKGEISGSTSHSIRALYKRATDSTGAHCPALWKAYIHFELTQLEKERVKRPHKSSRQEARKSNWGARVEEAEQRLKDTFYAGLRNLPWCKEYIMLVFTDAKDVFGDEEKWKLSRVMLEKELRLYVELDSEDA